MQQRLGYLIWAIIGLAVGVSSHLYNNNQAESDPFITKLAIFGFVLVAYGIIGTLFPYQMPPRKRGRARRSVVRVVAGFAVGFVVLVGITIGGIVLAVNSPPDTKQAILDSLFKCQTQMQTFMPADNSFTVNLPGFDKPTPIIDNTAVPIPNSYSVECGLNNYYVSYVPVPANLAASNTDPAAMLQTYLTMRMGTLDPAAVLKSTTPTMLNGQYPGLRYEIEMPTHRPQAP